MKIDASHARRVAVSEVQRWRVKGGLNPLAREVLDAMRLSELVSAANEAKRHARQEREKGPDRDRAREDQG